MARSNMEDFGLNSELLSNFEFGNGGPISSAQLSIYNVVGRYIDLHLAESSADYVVWFTNSSKKSKSSVKEFSAIWMFGSFLSCESEQYSYYADIISGTLSQGLAR